MTNKEMLQMRLDGATYQEIADKCGITRQAVHDAIKHYTEKITSGRRGHRFSYKQIKFVGIYEYFKNNENMSVSTFAKMVYGTGTRNSGRIATLRSFITGERNSHFPIPQIKRMCEIVGKSFEETFKERETE